VESNNRKYEYLEMTKSTNTLPHEEEVTPELLLRGYNKTKSVLNQYRKRIDDTGILIQRQDMWTRVKSTVKPSDLYIPYRSLSEEKTMRFLKEVSNPKTRKFWTLQNLVDQNVISEEELPLYDRYFPEGFTDFPVRIVHQYHRIKHNMKEYIWTNEEFRGVTNGKNVGGVVVTRMTPIYTWINPTVRPIVIDNTGNVVDPTQSNMDPDTVTKQILSTSLIANGEPNGTTEYYLDWSEDNFRSLYQLRNGELGNGHGLYLNKDGSSISIAVPNVDDYATMGFDALWKKYSTADTTIKINPEDFKSFSSGEKKEGGVYQ
jgi:hypothetical protein